MEDNKKFELSDDELDSVSGGAYEGVPGNGSITCDCCGGSVTYTRASASEFPKTAQCNQCGSVKTLFATKVRPDGSYNVYY